MTDMTDQDRRNARLWAEKVDPPQTNPGYSGTTSDIYNAARVILATVPAPPKSLADELRRFGSQCLCKADEEDLSALADRVESVEKEFDLSQESLAETLDREDIAIRERDEARADLATVTRQRDEARQRNDDLMLGCEGRDAAEWMTLCDEARADAGDKEREAQYLSRMVSELTSRNATLALQRDEARAENEKLRRTDNYKEFWDKFLTMQKGKESNAETLDPADVQPGEAWLVEVGGERRNAMKDNSLSIEWNTVNADGRPVVEDNEDVTLIARLVPDTRHVIYRPDELDRLAEGTIVRHALTHYAYQKIGQRWYTPGIAAPSNHEDGIGPVTVLWEPEVAE